MSDINFRRILETCLLHAGRMQWAMQRIADRLPFTADKPGSALSDIDLAVLDQFTPPQIGGYLPQVYP